MAASPTVNRAVLAHQPVTPVAGCRCHVDDRTSRWARPERSLDGASPKARSLRRNSPVQYAAPVAVGAMPTMGSFNGWLPWNPRRGVAEREDPPVGGDHPVAVSVLSRSHADDRLLRCTEPVEPKNLASTEGEDAAVRRIEPVPLPSGVGAMPTTAWFRTVLDMPRYDVASRKGSTAPPLETIGSRLRHGWRRCRTTAPAHRRGHQPPTAWRWNLRWPIRGPRPEETEDDGDRQKRIDQPGASVPVLISPTKPVDRSPKRPWGRLQANTCRIEP